MRLKTIILLCVLCLVSSSVYAACFGAKHVVGTSGTTDLCRKEARLNKDLKDAEEEAEFQRRKKDIQERIDKAKNSNSGSQSTGNQIVQNIGAGLLGGIGSQPAKPLYESPIAETRHQFELNYSAYIFPSMAGFERQMPELRPNGFSWIYNLSKSFAVVGMYQLFSLKGKQFNPITEERQVDEQIEVVDPDTGEITLATRTVTKEFTIYQPGAISSQYTRLLYFAQLTGAISDEFAIYGRLGSGMSKAKVEYSVVDANGSETTESDEFTSKQPWAFEVGLRKMFGGINTGVYTRIVEGDNGEQDYLKYIDMTTIEFGINVTFGLPSLGMI